MADSTIVPSSVSIGFRPISIGKLAAVLLQTEQVAAGAHRPRFGMVKERAAQLRMVAAEALGHQHLDRLAQHLGAREAEQPLGLGVDHFDHARAR